MSRWRSALWMLVGLGLLAVLEAPSALGRPPSELERGIRAYEKGELKKAAPLLRRALSTLESGRRRARAWLYLGLTQAESRDRRGARKSFIFALTEDPLVSPDRERVPPQIVAQFDGIRKTLMGLLEVDADHPRARVFVDEKEHGLTPLRLRVPVGKHRIKVVSQDGYRVRDGISVVVSVQEPARVRAKLAPLYGRVVLEVEPPGAQVFSRGKLLATVPTTQVSLTAGSHLLVIRLPGYREETRSIVVRPEQTVSLRVNLTTIPRAWYQRRRTWGWISVGVSGAALLTGLLAGKTVRMNEQEINERFRDGTLTYERFQVLESSASRNATIANIFLGLAGAAAVTGLVLVLTDRTRESAPPRPAWRVVPAGAGLAVLGRF